MAREIYQGLIAVGQRIHCTLYGGKDGSVVEIHGTQKPTSCRSFGGGVGVTGGTAHLDIIWDNGTESRGIPESLARASVQWRIHPDVVGAEAIAEARAKLAVETARRTAERDAAQVAFQAESERLRTAFPQLKQLDAEPDAFRRAIANIRILLKESFPKVKFSVRKDHHQCIEIRWTDGPTTKRIEKIANQFEAGHFDGMDDSYHYERRPWTTVFGDSDYIFCYRSVSDDVLLMALDRLYERLDGNLKDVPRPSLDVLKGFGVSPAVPQLNMTVNEGVNAIANAWDAVAGRFSLDGYHRFNWLIEPLIEDQHEKTIA